MSFRIRRYTTQHHAARIEIGLVLAANGVVGLVADRYGYKKWPTYVAATAVLGVIPVCHYLRGLGLASEVDLNTFVDKVAAKVLADPTWAAHLARRASRAGG